MQSFAITLRHSLRHSCTWAKHDPLTSELARCYWLVVVGHKVQRERLARVDPELREHPLRVVAHRVRVDSETLRDLAVS